MADKPAHKGLYNSPHLIKMAEDMRALGFTPEPGLNRPRSLAAAGTGKSRPTVEVIRKRSRRVA